MWTHSTWPPDFIFKRKLNLKLMTGSFETDRVNRPLTLFGPDFFPTPRRGGDKMAHCHNSCISSQMKLKLGSNIIWIMLTLNSGNKLMTSSFCFYDVTIIFITGANLNFLVIQFSSDHAQIWFRGSWGPGFKFQLKKWIKHQVLILVKDCLSRWLPWQQGNIYTQTLILHSHQKVKLS